MIWNFIIWAWFVSCGAILLIYRQEAQLPQRNSASAAHMEWAKPSSPLPLPPPATPMRTVESETRNKRMPSVPSVKRTLSWIGHSRSFKVILICADRNPERCIVVMSNECRRYSWNLRRYGNRNTVNSSISTTPLKFGDVPARNAFEYLQTIYIARNYSHWPTFLLLIVWVYIH